MPMNPYYTSSSAPKPLGREKSYGYRFVGVRTQLHILQVDTSPSPRESRRPRLKEAGE